MKIAPHLLIQLIFVYHFSVKTPCVIWKAGTFTNNYEIVFEEQKILRIRMNTYKKGREETHAGMTLKSK